VQIETFSVGPLGCNCALLVDPDAHIAIVVDPGGDLEVIRARLRRLGVTSVEAIVHTHTHIDHVGATAGLQRDFGASAQIHEHDRFLYDMLPVQAAMLRFDVPERAEMEGSLVDGGTLRAGAVSVSVLHTPGHTPGSVSFFVKSPEGSFALTGDTLFRRGIGRTDLWGGDSKEILRSLEGKLLRLPDDAIVIPGHGPRTTIGDERATNPFLRS
jgi:glyoxylase-like metal-dependent hydrolase (beta-lactamase superfamily II)